MQSAIAIGYAVLLLGSALLSMWLATVDYRRGRALHQQSAPTWPLEFPVYWLDYYLGAWLAKFLRLGQLFFLVPIIGLKAFDIFVRHRESQGMLLIYLAFVVTMAIRTYLPKICRIDDQGINFERQFSWAAIHRWKINDRRLLLVAECPDQQKMLAHIEIPLNGLPPAFRAFLEEQLEAHAGQPAISA